MKGVPWMVLDPLFVEREFDPSNDDEVGDYGDEKAPLYGFHRVSRDKARQLVMCDWLDPEFRHEHVEGGESIDDYSLSDQVDTGEEEDADVDVDDRVVVEEGMTRSSTSINALLWQDNSPRCRSLRIR